jgi:hypothetical protein
MSLTRVRHDHNFILWSALSAAVAYGCSACAVIQRTGIFFGHSCTDKSLFAVTEPFCDVDEYFAFVDYEMDRVCDICVLFEGDERHTIFKVCIGMFENSQLHQPSKFQRGFASGRFVRLTSRAYLQPWQGTWQDTPFPRLLPVDLTYINQPIPSPAGMLAFERFLELSFSCNIGKVTLCVTDPCLALGNGTPAFDASGDQVKGYMKVVRAASILCSINLHLSRVQPYLFEPVYYSTNENISRIQAVLRQQKQRHAVLAKASGFMRASVLSTRGRRPKSKLNCLPVLEDNEVTNEGMQYVAMKMCLRGRLLVARKSRSDRH